MSRYRSCVPVQGMDPPRSTFLTQICHNEPTSQQKLSDFTVYRASEGSS